MRGRGIGSYRRRMADFVRAVATADIPEGAGRLWRHGAKRIALFRTPAGVYAADNRCPHQGYALKDGDIRGDVLTCAWHNWKFRLTDGKCLFGGEGIRTYPVSVRDGWVHVDVTDPAPEEEVRRPPRPQPEPADVVTGYGSTAEGLAVFPALVDDERGDEAEALLRGLLASGAAPGQIRHAFLTAITDHFLGYGHPMIYCQKAFALLDRIGWSEADTVLAPLVPAIAWSTRYDRLPYMRRFLRALESDRADPVPAAGTALDGPGLRRVLLDGMRSEEHTSELQSHVNL